MTSVANLSPADIAGNLRLLRLLAEISSNFVLLPSDQMDALIEETQKLIVETMEIDRSTLWQFVDNRAGLVLTHCWQRPGWSPIPPNFDASLNLPWSHANVLMGRMFHFSKVDHLPPEAALDQQNFRSHGPKSNVTIPLLAAGKVFGALAFATLEAERNWTSDEINGLGLVARIISNALGRRRAERNAELLRNELARVSRASVLGEIAAGLAHEINQPLASILCNAQAARRFITNGTIDPVELVNILDDIIRDNKRASGVIRNLRDALDGTPLARNPCCVNELIAEVRAFTQASLSRDHIILEIKTGEARIPVHTAKVEIQQVLANLIHNASQAMAETPIGRREITVDSRISDGKALVSVADHGCGFPPDEAGRLFSPFHSNKPTGLGMGLAICRRIIEANGGMIEARTRVSGGAVFSFTLPLSNP